MRWLLVAITVLVVSVGMASAEAKKGWKRLDGKTCPPFRVESWLNTGGAEPQPEDLAGRVWVLEFLSVG
jgi:hypothetical protein